MISIRPLLSSDCATLAEAHINHLRTPFKGRAGIQLLTIYYHAFVTQHGGTAFVAVDNGDFLGFVCAIWNRRAIRYFLMKNTLRLIFPALRYSIRSPRHVFNVLHKLISPIDTYSLTIKGYELRPLVVLPQHRGRAVADMLVRRLLLDALDRGFDHISLFTEHDNLAAQSFYKRVGFFQVQTIHTRYTDVQLFRYNLSDNDSKPK